MLDLVLIEQTIDSILHLKTGRMHDYFTRDRDQQGSKRHDQGKQFFILGLKE